MRSASASDTDRPVLLFLYDAKRVECRSRPPLWLVARIGFRSIVASWPSMGVSDGETIVREGIEVLDSGDSRALPELRLRPRVIVHRTQFFDGSVPLMADPERSNPDALLSFRPCWRELNSKWIGEQCFRAGEEVGIEVPRPATYLVEKRDLRLGLRSVGASRPLIFKPSDSESNHGLLASTPATFEAVVERAVQSKWDPYVVQDLVQDLVLYRGKKLTLRIYALVTSFDRLQFKVYRDGIVHLAAQKFVRDAAPHPLRDLSAVLIRQRRGIQVDDVTISELLRYLETQGYRTSDFWDRLEALVRNVLACLAGYPPLQGVSDRARRFYLAGIDLLIVPRGDDYDFLFLETNYAPALLVGGNRLADQGMERLHREWVADLWQLARKV